jgi:hypothetical protein
MHVETSSYENLVAKTFPFRKKNRFIKIENPARRQILEIHHINLYANVVIKDLCDLHLRFFSYSQM